MSAINRIRISGVTYDIGASGGGVTSGEVETMISAATSGYTERFAEDEEVTAAGLNALNDALSGKQDTLIAGTNITISGNVISASGGGGSGTSTVELTQAEYDALVSGGTVDPTTYYIITDATPIDISNYWTSAQTESAITNAVSGKADTSAVTESINAAVSGKQDTLVSGTNIKTINNESLLGSGNITIQGGGGGTTYSAGTNISIDANNAINCTLPISGDTNGIYTTSSYPFGGTAFKSKNVVFGHNNSIDKNGSTSFMSYNFMTGRNNNIGDGGYNSNNMYNNFVSGENNIIYPSSYSNCAVFGRYNATKNNSEFASGSYNNSNYGSTAADNTLFSVGNGTADNARHNAFEIRQNGDIYISSGGTDIKLQDNLGGGGGGGTTYTAGTGIDITNDVISVTGMVNTSAITSSVTSASTDSEIPTAKAVFDAIPTGGTGGGKAISAGTNISVTTGETADTVSCTLPISMNGNINKYNINICGASNTIGTNTYNSTIIGSYNQINGGTASFYFQNNTIVGYNDKIIASSVNSYDAGYNTAFGSYNTISGSNISNSFVCGKQNKIYNSNESAFGYYNNTVTGSTNADKTLFSVGNGTNNNARHNAFEIRQNGDIYITSGGTDIKLQDNLGGGAASSAITSGDTNAVQGGAVYDKFDEVESVTAAALNNLNDKFGGLKLQQITQSDYDALVSGGTVDSSTLYIITNVVS